MAKGKSKQLKITGTERKDRITEIEKAAASYVAARDERMDLTQKESEAQTKLVGAMQKHELTEYRCDDEDMMVTLKLEGVKAKVKRISKDVEDED